MTAVRSDNENDTAGVGALSPTNSVPPRVPVVAIVGRPNVGKSTLFNRLVHAQRAIVDSRPGVTRDRNIALGRWSGRLLMLIDTGGFEDGDAARRSSAEPAPSGLLAAVRAQSLFAAEEADAVIAVFDGRAGLSPTDRDLVARLRRLRKPVAYAINKLDTPAHDAAAADFFALGLEESFPISSAHGRGMDALLDHVLEQLPAVPVPAVPVPAMLAPGAAVEERHAAAPVTVAIVGKPNVGKSSLLNRIVGQERAIVDAAPGTTRDPLDTPFRLGQQEYLLIDTAGIRRRPRVHEQLERSSVVRALKAIERAEVALVVIDATQGVTDQDARIAGYAWERGRGVLLAVNKWDAVPRQKGSATRFLEELRERYASLSEVPAVFVSARTGVGINRLFPGVTGVVTAHRQHLRTAELNRVLNEAVHAQPPASVRGKRPRFFYATQTGTAPPVISIFCSDPSLVLTSYERYLSNTFRRTFGLHGTPLRLRFRRRERR